MKKVICSIVFAMIAFCASAQTNLQTFYDFGHGYLTTTVEMFKEDAWGDNYFFIDHYFGAEGEGHGAVNGTYFEFVRNLNFWRGSGLKDLSASVEYDGGNFGQSVFCLGVNYSLHSDDFSKTFSATLLYDFFFGGDSADLPLKFTGVWNVNALFGIDRLVFDGFLDFWGHDTVFEDGTESHFAFLTEPQLWYPVGNHLNIGAEMQISSNYINHQGFKWIPRLGVKWNF